MCLRRTGEPSLQRDLVETAALGFVAKTTVVQRGGMVTVSPSH
jgi:hypothetical protein